MRTAPLVLLILAGCASPPAARPSDSLPGLYLRMMESEIAAFERDPEGAPTTGHLAAALMAESVLYSKSGDRKRLEWALKAGDLLAERAAKGEFTKPLNHRWDFHFWLDAYRLLGKELGEERRARWRSEIEKLLASVVADVRERVDYPRYQSPYIRTSPNHYSLWASSIHLAGKVFGNREWEELGGRVMRRFCAEEQTADGYWGEHSDSGPTPGYNYLTMTSVALYYEHSGDPVALVALRRATDLHTHYTWPDGTPVDVINDRNRRWGVSHWGHFGFSHFPDGRRYAEFLMGFLKSAPLGTQGLGRVAQNALYYHEGPQAPIPQDLPRFAHRMKAPAGIRKGAPWTIALSALISTSAVTNQFYLDRQGHVSVFHDRLGQIVTGANSKRQPELGTFREKAAGAVNSMPTSSRLRMSDAGDRLSLAYNTFFADLEFAPPAERELKWTVTVTERGRAEEAFLTFQLKLKPGEPLETATSKAVVGADPIDLDVGGLVRHRGWTLRTDGAARLVWPVYPFYPYSNGPEKDLEHAVAALSIPLKPAPAKPGSSLRTQVIRFSLEADAENAR